MASATNLLIFAPLEAEAVCQLGVSHYCPCRRIHSSLASPRTRQVHCHCGLLSRSRLSRRLMMCHTRGFPRLARAFFPRELANPVFQ